jgi:hypothetical protein
MVCVGPLALKARATAEADSPFDFAQGNDRKRSKCKGNSNDGCRNLDQ